VRLALCAAILAAMAACSTKTAQQPLSSPAALPAQSATAQTPTASPAEVIRVISGVVGFQSPTGNIHCDIVGGDRADNSGARCDTASHSWTIPPRPSTECIGDWYGRIGIEDGRAQFECASEATLSGPVLPYGHALRDGAILCESSEAGVKCTSQITGHGFTVSRQTYTLY
jgi:hypothetical protein